MFRPLARSHRRPHRRGTSFTLIVVVMISFAAAVGVAFALFAGQTLRINAANKEGQGGGGFQPPRAPEPNSTINHFLSALIYDVGDDNNDDLRNALRGHSFARSMYGRDMALFIQQPGGGPALGSTTPWAGVGPFHEDIGTYGIAGLTGDRAGVVNYTQMRIRGVPVLVDPEYRGKRDFAQPGGGRNPFLNVDAMGNPVIADGRAYVGRHAGYSFADLKDFYLASVDPASGQVLTPSFYRPWLFGSLDPNNGQTGVPNLVTNNWFNDSGRLKLLRPRPGGLVNRDTGVMLDANFPPEHPRFPRVGPNADGSYTGDVQNWPGGFTYVPNPDPALANDPTKGRYYGRNDSLWMYTGLPPVQFGGRKVVPMIAPLIVPLDALVNLSVHGNRFRPDPAPPAMGQPNPSHASYQGFGPWEVNPFLLLGPDSATVVDGRGNPTQRAGATQREYDPYRIGRIQEYAPVAWNGVPAGPVTYPLGADFSGMPLFSAFQSDNSATATANPGLIYQSHPALFNPAQWSSIGSPRTYPLSDLKRLQLRYAFSPDWYAAMDLAQLNGSPPLPPGPPASVVGNPGAYPFVYAPKINTYNAYRTDPAHGNRQLLTTRSYALDRPKLAPNFANHVPLELVTDPDGKSKPGFVAGNGAAGPARQYPTPGSPLGTITDFASTSRWVNALASLGSANLNRGMADYRGNTNQSLSVGNGNNPQADKDRRQMAHDIFVRLVVATGANAVVGTNGLYTLGATAGSQFDALKYLAQLAVNIVDYIDNDDVNTVWTWNPPPPPPNGSPRLPTDPLDQNDFAPGVIGTRVVIGTEKPRLVINEAYAEIVNDPADPLMDLNANNNQQQALPPGKLAHVRFWVELLNPSPRLTPGGGPGPTPPPANPLGDGSVRVAPSAAGAPGPYQIEIARARRSVGGVVERPALDNTDTTVCLDDPLNVNGQFKVGLTPDITYSSFAGAPDVAPNAGNSAPGGPGFLMVGPRITPVPNRSPKNDEFNPPAGPGAVMTTEPITNTGSRGMAYSLPMPDSGGLSNQDFRRHVILLRRLANPYAAPNDPTSNAFNPMAPINLYVTVDAMDYVPAFDGVNRVPDASEIRIAGAPTPAKRDATKEYDPSNERAAVGKVQPFAGRAGVPGVTWPAGAPGAYNTYSFPGSMVLDQKPKGATAHKNTFGRHNYTGNGQGPNGEPNGSTVTGAAGGPALRDGDPAPGTPPNSPETLMLPFDWLVHMDRALVNQIELFAVRDSAPHRLTQDFVRPNPMNGNQLDYTYATARWESPDAGLARALELLTVKSHVSSVAHGGRVPGQINVNALQDRRVLTGLFDQQINQAGWGATFMDTAWNSWIGSRSGVRNGQPLASMGGSANVGAPPSASVHDSPTVGAGLNRPFMPFGAPVASPGAFAYTSGGNIDDTILRRATGQTLPVLYAPSTSPAAAYMQHEPVRKVFNNITTVNHTYLVFMTISYFEIDLETLNPVTNQRDGLLNLDSQPNGLTMPRLAQEAYFNVPGDLRQKVVAVVDMTGMTMEPRANVQAPRPYFTTLEEPAYPAVNSAVPGMPPQVDTSVPITLYVNRDYISPVTDGVAAQLGNTLVLGYGAEQQIVTLASGVPPTGPPRPGTAQIVVTGLSRPVWGGSSVSNVRPGYPGVQGAAFDYNDDKYKPVVPFLQRVK